jgi:hypothetical protein
MNLTGFRVITLCAALLLFACKKKETTEPELSIYGSGKYTFSDYEPFSNKPVSCFYHIPEASNANSPVMIILPGAGRDAQYVRDGLVTKADQKGFVLVSLEFPNTYFPGADVYNMANIFEDGDNPEPSSLNPAEEWTFSVIDPLFQDFKGRTGLNTAHYDIVGFSAGAQLVHRFLIFNANAGYNRVVTASAGWYNIPDDGIDFPYGLAISPMEGKNLQPVFERRNFVIVGANDNDPNAPNLRHTPEADAQGSNRVERAQYFYQTSRDLAVSQGSPFNWAYQLVPNADHDSRTVLRYAADVLYK